MAWTFYLETIVAEKELPKNILAEQCVIGSLLLIPEIADELLPLLNAADFFNEYHGEIYAQIVAFEADNQRFDENLLLSAMKKKRPAVQWGPVLLEALDATATPATAVAMAKEVRDHAISRRMIDAASRVQAIAWNPRLEPAEKVSKAEAIMFGAFEHGSRAEVRQIGDVLLDVMDDIEARGRGEKRRVVPSGIAQLDEMMGGGFSQTGLTIVAGRPSMGKSGMACSLAEYAAERGEGVLFCTVEMSNTELVERMLYARAGVNSFSAKHGRLTPTDHQRIGKASADIGNWPISFIAGDLGASDVCSAARRLKRKNEKLRLVVVDYLQKMRTDAQQDENRAEQLGKITGRLKGLAMDLEVPVILLSQLNRSVESTESKKPKMHHLRESGAIEQDADIILMLHRESYYADAKDVEQHKGRATIIVAKQRNGPTGEVAVAYDEMTARFGGQLPQDPQLFD